jgi:hypothetical protein
MFWDILGTDPYVLRNPRLGQDLAETNMTTFFEKEKFI